MSGYIGNIPTPQATQTRDTFTATAGQTTFATRGYTPSFLDVFLNGVHLVNGTDYTATNGSDVVLTSGAAAGDTLEVVAYSTFEASDVTASSGFTVTGNLSVDGGTIKLDGNYPVGTANVALGDLALSSNVTGVNNTAVGSVSQLATTGDQNTSIGASTLRYNTSGSYNTALGTASLFNTTTASNNTGVGYRALFSNTTASNNTAVGHQALYDNTAGNNTAVGWTALANNTTGSGNTAVGLGAGGLLTTGSSNTFIGYKYGGNGSGQLITTGSKNTILGPFDGNQGGLDIRTSSNNIVLSDGDGNPRAWHDSTQWNNIANYTLIGETSMNGYGAISFDSFPSWVSEILLVFDDPYMSGNTEFQVNLRSGGSNISSGYQSWLKNIGGGSLSTQGKFTGSVRVFTAGTQPITGRIRVTKVRDGSTDYWTFNGQCLALSNDTMGISSANLQTTSTVNGIRIYSNDGTSTFTGGYARCYVKG